MGMFQVDNIIIYVCDSREHFYLQTEENNYTNYICIKPLTFTTNEIVH